MDAAELNELERESVAEREEQTGARSFRLRLCDVAGATDAVREAAVPPANALRGDSAFALSETDVLAEVVRVHLRDLREKELDARRSPSLFGPPSLREQRMHVTAERPGRRAGLLRVGLGTRAEARSKLWSSIATL